MSFISFWRRNLALFKLGIVTNLEYRFNFFIDAFLQPILSVAIELLMWIAIFKSAETTSIGGFTKEYYLAYAAWAPFIGRITISWMYESMMVEEVVSGSINTILTRPLSFYEYYLSQMMGYKLITTFLSLLVPVIFSLIFKLPIHYERLPLVLLIVAYYLLLIHTLSFIISTFGFYLTRVRSLTLVKNISLTLLSGEIVPVDLMPESLQKLFLILPFSNGVYAPLAYLTGRKGIEIIHYGFFNISAALLISGFLAYWLWVRGIREYTGTGA